MNDECVFVSPEKINLPFLPTSSLFVFKLYKYKKEIHLYLWFCRIKTWWDFLWLIIVYKRIWNRIRNYCAQVADDVFEMAFPSCVPFKWKLIQSKLESEAAILYLMTTFIYKSRLYIIKHQLSFSLKNSTWYTI